MNDTNRITKASIDNCHRANTLRINNPEWLLQSEVAKINRFYRQLEKFGFTIAEFHAYLDTHHPQRSTEIHTAWEKINNDIYARFLDGRLKLDEFRQWCSHLWRWSASICSAIDSFLRQSKNMRNNSRARQKAA